MFFGKKLFLQSSHDAPITLIKSFCNNFFFFFHYKSSRGLCCLLQCHGKQKLYLLFYWALSPTQMLKYSLFTLKMFLQTFYSVPVIPFRCLPQKTNEQTKPKKTKNKEKQKTIFRGLNLKMSCSRSILQFSFLKRVPFRRD